MNMKETCWYRSQQKIFFMIDSCRLVERLNRTCNGTSYSRITAVASGTTLEYVASAFNGWQAVKIGSQVGWVSGEFSEITTE